jgi:hypothetical protein
MANAGLLLLAVSAVAFEWPRVVAIPVSVMLAWVALSLLFRARHAALSGKGLGERSSSTTDSGGART